MVPLMALLRVPLRERQRVSERDQWKDEGWVRLRVRQMVPLMEYWMGK